MTPYDEVVVGFCGARDGTAALTWGQRDIHRGLLRYSPHGAFANLRAVVDVPAGATMADLTDALRCLVEEHEALRTTYPVDETGRPCQLLHRQGEITVRVVELAPGAPVATGLPGFGHEFDYARELPVRVVVVTEAHRPKQVLLEISHLSVDSAGCRVVRAALHGKLTGAERPVARRYQPLDRAADEATPEAVATGRRAVAYLAGLLDAFPSPMFTPGAYSPAPRPKVKLTSPPLGEAVIALAERHRVTDTSVYVTLMGLFTAVLANRRQSLFSMVASNRWVHGGRSYAGTLNQYGLIGLPVAGIGLADLLRRAQVASLESMANAAYDVEELAAAGGLTALDHVDCVLNCNQVPAGGPVRTGAAGVRTLTELEPIRLVPRGITRTIQLSVGGTAAAPELSLSVDPAVFPDLTAAAMLCAIEAAAARLADPAAVAADPDALVAEVLSAASPVTVGAGETIYGGISK
ncbi:condensation domain-containing protein [Catellatospora tritici]|uniref:condensation domain-containing protein n=1 Tax=Catellatospora tritici TaxID=2851566 RepID=UPI001C2D1DE2|nr:condensation domain-containing protein [Catellatospora tritici]MBV1849573.1 hypothetical protein [Catellatospora tritici]